MNRTLGKGISVVLVGALASLCPRPDASARLKLEPVFGAAPLHFVANHGQAAAEARFYARAKGYTLWLTEGSLLFDRADSSVSRLVFKGANKKATLAAAEPSGYRVSYFYGRDESEWITDVPTSRAVVYKDLYDGIDLKVYGNENMIEYDWIVRPGADPGRIRFAAGDAGAASIGAEGDLVVTAGSTEIRHRKPNAYQTLDGRRIAVAASFVRTDGGDYRFDVGAYDRHHELVIDPLTLIYSTYLGGRGPDSPFALAVDAAGCPYVAGYTVSTDFPPAEVSMPRSDAFVTKLSADGSELVYTAFFPIMPFGIFDLVGLAVDGKGSAYLTGATKSRGFPVKNAFQPEMAGGGIDGFFLKLTPNGNGLVYSSFLGGGGYEYASHAAVDPSGSLTVAGSTASGDFPISGGVQKARRGQVDMFVAKFSPDGRGLVYSTYLGGYGQELLGALAVDGTGAAYLTGTTTGRGFPVKNAFQKQVAGKGDVFITKLASAGDRIVYSSYLGGTSDEFGRALAVDAAGAAFIAGYTTGTFPLRNAFQKTRKGSYEGFVSKIAPNGKSLEFSSYLGGGGYDMLDAIALDAGGTVYVAGSTESRDFPLKAPIQSVLKGSMDGVLTAIAPDGRTFDLSTFLGGRYEDGLGGIALDADGNIILMGSTNSPDFPIQKAYQKTLAGSKDAVILKYKRSGD